MRDFHCCATCVNFLAKKNEQERGMIYRCTRLGYDTRPEYKFDCWDPKPHVIKLMEKEKKKKKSS
ncbi:hypothetical protein [Salirhabdus sp. Marseille-P4669]|uniref:hypothetical protein n=1 Tax=Salirhabdus sp. Marseille-P4669 TaxID=2042310 RepID=UPI000C7AD9DD|nr:hypothetical protein [Salirhabdus sp. Marseille-P4669]